MFPIFLQRREQKAELWLLQNATELHMLLGTWFRGGLCSVRLAAGLDDLSDQNDCMFLRSPGRSAALVPSPFAKGLPRAFPSRGTTRCLTCNTCREALLSQRGLQFLEIFKGSSTDLIGFKCLLNTYTESRNIQKQSRFFRGKNA